MRCEAFYKLTRAKTAKSTEVLHGGPTRRKKTTGGLHEKTVNERGFVSRDAGGALETAGENLSGNSKNTLIPLFAC